MKWESCQNGYPIIRIHNYISLLLFLLASNINRSLRINRTMAESRPHVPGGIPVDAMQQSAYKRTGA